MDRDGAVSLAGDGQLPGEDALLIFDVVSLNPAVEPGLPQRGAGMLIKKTDERGLPVKASSGSIPWMQAKGREEGRMSGTNFSHRGPVTLTGAIHYTGTNFMLPQQICESLMQRAEARIMVVAVCVAEHQDRLAARARMRWPKLVSPLSRVGES